MNFVFPMGSTYPFLNMNFQSRMAIPSKGMIKIQHCQMLLFESIESHSLLFISNCHLCIVSIRAIRSSEEVSPPSDGTIRKVARIYHLSRWARSPDGIRNTIVVVVQRYNPDPMCDLPRRIRPIRIGCEGKSGSQSYKGRLHWTN